MGQSMIATNPQSHCIEEQLQPQRRLEHEAQSAGQGSTRKDNAQPVAGQSLLSPSQQKPVAPIRMSAFSERLQAANAEHLNARSASPATDASQLRSPFREDSQFAQLGTPHDSTPKVSYQQEEEARAYQAEAHLAQTRAYSLYKEKDSNTPTTPTINPRSALIDYETVPGEDWF